MPAVGLYDEVLRELIAALGAALFIGNLVALIRRRSDTGRSGTRGSASTRPGSPVRGNRRGHPASTRAELARAPLARTLAYLSLGFIIMVWGIASLATR